MQAKANGLDESYMRTADGMGKKIWAKGKRRPAREVAPDTCAIRVL